MKIYVKKLYILLFQYTDLRIIEDIYILKYPPPQKKQHAYYKIMIIKIELIELTSKLVSCMLNLAIIFCFG